jgi:hypothetical protein
MPGEHIDVTGSGEDVSLPLVDILTGRGFVTGKSGSGKSTSVNVVVEEILDLGQPLLIVDTDGEYWGLKEQYQILHLGNGQQCDVRVTATDAETIVDLALVERVPIILDISGFIHEEDAQDIVYRVVRELFHREKTLKEPFLLIVEEVHEYIPETGGLTEMGEMLIQVAKRGRKHGLGFCGVSQRPASVDKDFITQCDWMVWHRLTWKNDTEVVRTILGSDASTSIQELEPGEALLMTDWDEQVREVQFRQKRTFDAGATPGFEDFEPPALVPVDPAILNRFDERRQNVDYAELDLPDTEPDEVEGSPESEPSEPESQTEPDVDAAVDSAATTDDGVDADPEIENGSGPEDVSSEIADADRPVPAGRSSDQATGPADRTDSELVANGVNRESPARARPRRAKAGRGGPSTTPPASGGEGVLVEFAELVLFLMGWLQSTALSGLARIAGSIGATSRWIGERTVLEDEDVVVALWIAVLIGAVLVLSVLIVVVT